MPKKVALNQNFFKKWSNGMAYVLGFFLADGCLTINPRGSHFIEFSSKDRDILEKIKTELESGHKIGIRKNMKNRMHDSYRLQLGSREMFGDLVELGFTVNKSKTVKLPEVPNKYFADFLRGYFDGDGCVSYNNYYRKQRKKHYKYIIVMFTSGSEDFLIKLAERINGAINVKIPKVIYHQAYRLSYLSENAVKILKFIYNDAGICLDRKFLKSKSAIKFMDW